MSLAEAGMKGKERAAFRAKEPYMSVSYRIADQLQQATGLESRVVVPGHFQRGGSPSPYDRVLATRFGVQAAKLIKEERYGMAVAQIGSIVTQNPLSEVAGKTKLVPEDHQMVEFARSMGIAFGD